VPCGASKGLSSGSSSSRAGTSAARCSTRSSPALQGEAYGFTKTHTSQVPGVARTTNETPRHRRLSSGHGAVVAATATTLTPRVAAHGDDRGSACHARTLRGGYGGLASGVRLIPLVRARARRKRLRAQAFARTTVPRVHRKRRRLARTAHRCDCRYRRDLRQYEVNSDCTGKSTRYVPVCRSPSSATLSSSIAVAKSRRP
jgi:hypothetical protein